MNELLQQRIDLSESIFANPYMGAINYLVAVRDGDVLHVAKRVATPLTESDFIALDAAALDKAQEQTDPHRAYTAVVNARLDYRDPLPPVEALALAGQGGTFLDVTTPPAVMIVYHATQDVIGHITPYGLLTAGETPDDAYNQLEAIVQQARQHPNLQDIIDFEFMDESDTPAIEIATLRKHLSDGAGKPLIVMNAIIPEDAPLTGVPPAVFVTAADTAYTSPTFTGDITSAPDDAQVVFDRGRGIFAAGGNVPEAARKLDIATRGAEIIAAANQLGGYTTPDTTGWGEPLPQPNNTPPRQFDGEIAFITGAASGIGRATAAVFLERGAAVIGIDINPTVINTFDSPQYLGIVGDVRVEKDVEAAVSEGVRTFGGIDIVFLNAGINEDHAPLEKANMDIWRWVMDTNLNGNMIVLKAVHKVLIYSPKGGRVIMNASKSAPAPGPGSSSYTVSKAAITQLGRVTALEWAKDRVRVYVVHPNAVFDTGIWKNNMAEKRATHYGMTLQQYKTNNLLKVEMTSRDVGEIVADLCGDHFRKVTGIQLPIDGGNERVI